MVLYSKLRPYLRKVTIAPYRGVCSADMYPLSFDSARVDSRFAMWSLLSEPFSRHAINASQRARMPKLNREQLFAWKMPLPHLARQRELVAAIDDQMSGANQLYSKSQEEAELLAKLPAAYLRQAFPSPLPGGFPRQR